MNNLEIPGIFSPHFQVKHLSDCQFVCLGSGLSDSLKHGKQYHSNLCGKYANLMRGN